LHAPGKLQTKCWGGAAAEWGNGKNCVWVRKHASRRPSRHKATKGGGDLNPLLESGQLREAYFKITQLRWLLGRFTPCTQPVRWGSDLH
jgi:hypothetical protein